MSAIITENFRRNNTSAFLADTASNHYYVGLGKSDPWNNNEASNLVVPDPLGTYLDEQEIKNNLISLIGVTSDNGTKVVPNNKFVAFSYYKAYDPLNDNCFYTSTLVGGISNLPCYVTVSDKIFLCLYAPSSVATQTPVYSNETDKYKPFVLSDGYVWILLDIINISLLNTVNTDQFISITKDLAISTSLATITTQQGNLLYGFNILNGGSNYVSGDTFTFTYTIGTSTTPTTVSITPTIVNGSVTVLPYNIVSSMLLNVSSCTVSVTTSTGTGFGAIAKIAPSVGFAYRPYKVLPSWYAALSVKATGLISNDGFYIPYRQISVIKNPEFSGATVDPLITLRALPYFTISTAPNTTLSTGDILNIASTETKIVFDTYVYESGLHKIYYHQNNVSNYGDTSAYAGKTLTNSNSTTVGTISNRVLGEYTANTGDVIFIENRKAITRSESQTEEIKIIIQF